MTKKENQETKKEEKVLDKDFKSQNKLEDVAIKELETKSKLLETKSKMGEKVETQVLLDNNTKKGKLCRTLIVCLIFAIIILIAFLILKYTGLLEKFNSAEEIKNFILSGGNFSILIFALIQFFQVTFLPIPAFLTTVAGALIFGPWKTLFISFIAIMLGSFFAFYLGRKFGQKILTWIAGPEEAKKWIKKLTNGKYAYFLMMLFPVFPDDILCIAAGVTNMTFKFFFITNLITRPIGIFCICFLGSGSLIPFSGYGLIVWPILIVLLLFLLIFSFKYQAKIEEFVDNLANKTLKNKHIKTIKTEEKNLKENKNSNFLEEKKENKYDTISDN